MKTAINVSFPCRVVIRQTDVAGLRHVDIDAAGYHAAFYSKDWAREAAEQIQKIIQMEARRVGS